MRACCTADFEKSALIRPFGAPSPACGRRKAAAALEPLSRTRKRGWGEGLLHCGLRKKTPSSAPSGHLLPQAGEGKRPPRSSPSRARGRGVGVRACCTADFEKAPSSAPSGHLLPHAGEGKRPPRSSPSPARGRGVGVRACCTADFEKNALIRPFGAPSPASGRREAAAALETLSRTRERSWGEGLLHCGLRKKRPHPPLRGTFSRMREKEGGRRARAPLPRAGEGLG